MDETGSCIPEKPSLFKLMAKKSAHLPASSEPISFLPNTAAPPRVPKYKASLAVMSFRFGSSDNEYPVMPSLTRESNIALRTSARRCEPSLEAEPSTPRPTLTPALRYSLIGAMPEARRILEVGQCATPQLCLAKTLISSSLTQTACANHTSLPTQSTDCIYPTGRCPNICIQNCSSSSVSARCVCRCTPYSRAIFADCFIKSDVTLKGEHGASTICTIAPGLGS